MRQRLLILTQRVAPLRLMAGLASHLFAPRQAVGVLAVIVNAEGRVLLAHHATRPHAPWGLPGGWIDRRERPEDGVLREVAEELDLRVMLGGYLGSHAHDYGVLLPRGLTLLYRLEAPGADGTPVVPRTWEITETRWATVEDASAVLHPRTAAVLRDAMSPPNESPEAR